LLPLSLHTLILNDCTHITDEGISSLKDYNSLHWLDVTETKVTYKGLMINSTNIPNRYPMIIGLLSLPPDLRRLRVSDKVFNKENQESASFLPRVLLFPHAYDMRVLTSSFFKSLRYLDIVGVREQEKVPLLQPYLDKHTAVKLPGK